MTPEHIALLDAIGMQWDAREAKWAGAFRRAEEYCAAHGNLLVPVNYKTEDGFCLGDWVRRMRENYACAEKKLTGGAHRKARSAGHGLGRAAGGLRYCILGRSVVYFTSSE